MGAGGGPSGRNIPESEIQNTLNGGEDFTIGENDTTVFSDDFEIPQGRTLTNNGTIDLADATVDITGNFINNGTVTNNLTTINLKGGASFRNVSRFTVDGNVNVDSKIDDFISTGIFQAGTFKILGDNPGNVVLRLFNTSSFGVLDSTFNVTNFENELVNNTLFITGGFFEDGHRSDVNINIDTMTSEGDISFIGINRNNSGEGSGIKKLDLKKGIRINESNIVIRNELKTETSAGSELEIKDIETTDTAVKTTLTIGPHTDPGERAVADVKIKMKFSARSTNTATEDTAPTLIIAENTTFNLINNVNNDISVGVIQVLKDAILQGQKTDLNTKISSSERGAILKTAGLVEGISFDNVQLDTEGNGQVNAGYLNDDGVIPEADAKTIRFDLTEDYQLSEKTISPERDEPDGFFNILYYKGKITFNQNNGEGDKVFPTGDFVDAAQGRFYAGDDNRGFTKSWFREFEDGEDPISLIVLPP